MPDEAMADDEHLVLLAEGDVAVGRLPVVLIGLGMHELPLQIVLRRGRVEVLRGEGGRIGVLAGDQRPVQSAADQERVLEHVFQRGHVLPGPALNRTDQ